MNEMPCYLLDERKRRKSVFAVENENKKNRKHEEKLYTRIAIILERDIFNAIR